MFQAIRKLKDDFRFKPDTVIDIGSNRGHWASECFSIYSPSDTRYILIDATDYGLKKVFSSLPNIEVHTSLLSDKQGETYPWYSINGTGDSIFKENTDFYENVEPVYRVSETLDALFYERKLGKTLMKVDCQGAELMILKGGKKILKEVEFLILEVPFFGKYNEGVPGFLEHIQTLDSLGFIPFDIIENHRVCTFNLQVDMLFIRKENSLEKLCQEKLLNQLK